ncbi:CRISPR-associated endonuclease Cas3'' [Stieleria sp. ICT_E10.1]|uniref:CRISPR-associated endonuclease Cas3'' n=1 Tax=Stieleria sedimenti TaxID=2976331 RepID=UPI00217F969C|nr:CRISPR-associated endonuclease Cas3'' [Stieleria sedimenti]MCS7466637.1 CRISPR-associated endonuclease Cas3'' [Stieleria sedimenti]
MQQHEQRVAALCRTFLGRIHPSLGTWGELLGRWHDLGKYSDRFQRYLIDSNDPDAGAESRPGRVDHSTAGAKHAADVLPRGIRDLFAYAIAGHQ